MMFDEAFLSFPAGLLTIFLVLAMSRALMRLLGVDVIFDEALDAQVDDLLEWMDCGIEPADDDADTEWS